MRLKKLNNNLDTDYTTKKKKSDIFAWLRSIGITTVVAGVIIIFVAQIVNINGQSMAPTFYHGDRVLMCKIDKNYKQGDIIVAKHVIQEPIIKRIIATEGQVVDFDLDAKEVTVNGKIIPGSKFNLPDGETIIDPLSGTMMKFPQTVPKDCVFVLGDNRMHSSDSRFSQIGMIPKDKILGKVILRIFPNPGLL